MISSAAERTVDIEVSEFAGATWAAYRTSDEAERTTEVTFEAEGLLLMPPLAIATVTLVR